MAIAVEVSAHGPGATMDNYFELLKRMGTSPEGRHPDASCLFHWIREEPNGYVVTDVWTDRASLDKFVEEKVTPISQELGMPQPHLKYLDVANYLTAGG
jgi:hypothetical protein